MGASFLVQRYSDEGRDIIVVSFKNKTPLLHPSSRWQHHVSGVWPERDPLCHRINAVSFMDPGRLSKPAGLPPG